MRRNVRRFIGVCGLALGLALVPLGGTHTALASSPSLSLSPSSATPGSSFTISGSGFHTAETISLYWSGSQVATLPTSATGTFTVRATLGSTMSPGARSILARGTAGDQAGATFTVLSAAATATPAPPQPAPTPTATPAPTSGIPSSGATSNGCQITPEQASAEQHLFTVLNQHRAAAGAAPLKLNATLSLASRQHSCDMFQHQHLSHTGTDGSSPFDRMRAVGVTFSTAGENIGMAGGYGLTGGIDTVDGGMMAEPLTGGNHHWNIVNAAYKQVGLGVIYANGQVWLTEDFTG